MILSNCGAEETLESLQVQGDQINNPKTNLEFSLEGTVDEAKLNIFDNLIWPIKADSLEKTMMLRKIESRRSGWQRMRWLDSVTSSMDMNLRKLLGDSGGQRSYVLKSMGSQNLTWLK